MQVVQGALQWHPHLHLLAADGAGTADDTWLPLLQCDGELTRLFRRPLLARLVEAHAISPELVARLLAWKGPGFSAQVGEPIAPEQKQRLEARPRTSFSTPSRSGKERYHLACDRIGYPSPSIRIQPGGPDAPRQ